MILLASIFLLIYGLTCWLAGWLNRGEFERMKLDNERRTLGRQVLKTKML